MMKLLNWLLAKQFRLYSLVFILMTIPAVLLYPATQSGATGLTLFLLGIIVFANLIVLGIK